MTASSPLVEPLRFIADVHLGKLARALRLLGFDTLYNNAYTNAELLNIAVEQSRVLLSRNTAFFKHPSVRAFVIQSENPDAQLQQVVRYFGLKDQLQPFSRCLVCNGNLTPVSKEMIASQLQPNTTAYFNEFWQCTNCHKIYWKGSHYDRMLRLIEKVKTFQD